MSKEDLHYDAVLPTSLIFNPYIIPAAKLFYAIIRNLCRKEGYCYAGNDYLSNLMGVDEDTIGKWLRSLEHQKYIRRDTKNINFKRNRKIFLDFAFNEFIEGIPPKDKDSNNFTDTAEKTVIDTSEKTVTETCEKTAVKEDNKNKEDSKKNEDIRVTVCSPPPIGDGVTQKFKKNHFDGHEVVCSLQEVFQYAISEKKNWKTEEIISSWKILEEYNGAIRCYLHFIDGTIENIKKKEKSELAIKNKGKKWMSTEESKNIQEKVVISYPTQQEGLPSHIPSKKEKSTECSPSYWERIFQAPV